MRSDVLQFEPGTHALAVGGPGGTGSATARLLRHCGCQVSVTGATEVGAQEFTIARAILFPPSPLAGFVIGETIRVDGGYGRVD